MPKDATGSQPLGVVTRHPADWFSDSLYSATFYEDIAFVGSGLLWHQFGLFNQNNNGRVLRIYGNTTFSEGGGGFQASFSSGSVGVQVGNATGIRPDQSAPSVSVWADHVQTALGTVHPFLSALPFGLLAAPGFDSGTTFSPFPMFIIPQGYSLVVTNPQSSSVAGVCWWFQLANL